MKNIVKRKLKSNNGASLMMAILLFVICAAIGAIVLTAGTISSRRLADKAEMDERYYKVISVAEVLKEEIDKKDAIIIRKKNSSNNTYTLDTSDNDFLTERTKELLNSTDNSEAMWNSDFYGSNVRTNEFTFNIVPDSSKPTENTTSVNVSTIVSYGKMELLITDNGYTVKMTFSPMISEVESIDGNITTKTSTVTWALNSMEKVF